MISAVLALTFLVTPGQSPVECTQQDRYTFEVRRPQKLTASDPALESLPVTIATMDSSIKSQTTVSGGNLEVCLPGVREGVIVKASPGKLPPRIFELLYPVTGTAVTHGASPMLVVCEEKVDCRASDAQASELFKLFQRERLSNAELVDRLNRVIKILEDNRVDSGQFAKLLEFKSRQIEAARDASEMLSEFENTAQEISVRFRRHAVQALDWNGNGPLDQISDAIHLYNKVYDRIQGKSDSYRKALAGTWDQTFSERFQGLVDEALSIHAQVEALNNLKEIVNSCHSHQSSCSDRPAARKQVSEGVARLTTDMDARLQAFATHRKVFLEDQNRILYDTTAVAAGRGPR